MYRLDVVPPGLEREEALVSRYLHASSRGAARACYERAALQQHLPPLHAHAPALLLRAAPAQGMDDDVDARYATQPRLHLPAAPALDAV